MRLLGYSIREILRRPGRTTLTLLGIAIGVSAIVAISITINTTRGAYRELFESISGRASLEVVAEGTGGFELQAVDELRKIDGVKSIVPAIQSFSALGSTRGYLPVMALGIDPQIDRDTRDYFFREGRFLKSGDEVMLEAGFAESQGIRTNDEVRMLTTAGTAKLKVVGLLEPRGPAAIAGGAIVIVPLPTAQRLFKLPKQINTAQLVLEPGFDVASIEANVAKVLPPGLDVQMPSARGGLSQSSMLSTEQGLAVMSVVSLVAGAFVILNTFLMSVGERQRQLAILRALGTTRWQLTRILLAEALLLGCIGTIVGIGLGLCLAVALTRGMEGILQTHLPDLKLSLQPFLLAAVLGPGMAVAATYVPARKAAGRSILAGLFDELTQRSEQKRSIWPGCLGIALIALANVVVAGFLNDWFPSEIIDWIVRPTMAAFLVGSVLLIPFILGPLSKASAIILGPLLGVEGRIAFRQLDRRRQRTALTVGVLFIAIVVSIGMGNSLMNNIRDISDWTERTIVSDFLIRSVVPDTGILMAASMPEELAAQFQSLGGVERVDKLNFVPARVSGQRVLLIARDWPADRPVGLDLAEGDPDEVLRGLLSGEAVLGTSLAHRLGLHRGDTITLETRMGPKRLRIAGTSTEYTAGGASLYVDRETVRKLMKLNGVDVLMIRATEGQLADLNPRLKEFCEREHLLIQSQSDFRKMIDGMMSGVVGFLWLLMALVFVVASLGVVNTLTMNAMEQTREFGVLRAIGLLRRQIGRMVLAEAISMALISVVPGVVMGIALAFLMNASTYPIVGHPVDFRVEAGFVIACAAAALAISVLAALLPARRASALKIVRALQYE